MLRDIQRQSMHTARPTSSIDFQISLSVPPVIEIRSLAHGDDATPIRTLNEEWITRYFTLEAKDRETLNDPVHSILLRGGHIFMAYAGAEAVGCVALIAMQDGIYELSKMAVSPHLRGKGLGRRLLQHAIVQARSIGARSLFLGSNTRLKDAVHLYESVGFRHVKPRLFRQCPIAAPMSSWRCLWSQIHNKGSQRDPVRWFKMKSCAARRGAPSATIPAHFVDSPTCFHGAPPPRAALAFVVEQPTAFSTSSTHPESGPLPMLEHFQNIQRNAFQRKIWVESAL
jgi:putative acetyltransferase